MPKVVFGRWVPAAGQRQWCRALLVRRGSAGVAADAVVRLSCAVGASLPSGGVVVGDAISTMVVAGNKVIEA